MMKWKTALTCSIASTEGHLLLLMIRMPLQKIKGVRAKLQAYYLSPEYHLAR